MSSLNDVYNLYQNIVKHITLFGCTSSFEEEFQDRFNSIGVSFCDDYNIKPEEAIFKPIDINLGEKSEEKFQELNKWLNGEMCRHSK